MEEQFESNDGIGIGTAVTIPDGRFGKVKDLYYKNDTYFAEILLVDETVLLDIPVNGMKVGYEGPA